MGHAPSDVWGYSPRQIAGFLFFAGKRQRALAAQGIMVARAAQAKAQDVKRLVKELTK